MKKKAFAKCNIYYKIFGCVHTGTLCTLYNSNALYSKKICRKEVFEKYYKVHFLSCLMEK